MRTLRVEHADELRPAVESLAIDAPRAVVVVVGGAAGLDAGRSDALQQLGAAIVDAAAACDAVIVDGGTDAGIMQVVGRAHESRGHSNPLVGVVVEALAALPGRTSAEGSEALEPHHSHFLLVPGSAWGDEAAWIAQLAGAIAGADPSVTVLVNGGEIAWTDAAESVRAQRPVLAVAGTGRTADVLAAAAAGGPTDERSAPLVASGLVERIDTDALGRRIEQILMSKRSDDVR